MSAQCLITYQKLKEAAYQKLKEVAYGTLRKLATRRLRKPISGSLNNLPNGSLKKPSELLRGRSGCSSVVLHKLDAAN
jgi:hypothetical protein